MTSENISTVFLLENFSVVADSRGYSANCLSELYQRSRLCADRSADAADAVCQQHPQTASVFKGLLCLCLYSSSPKLFEGSIVFLQFSRASGSPTFSVMVCFWKQRKRFVSGPAKLIKLNRTGVIK